jgi:hypothetical protein
MIIKIILTSDDNFEFFFNLEQLKLKDFFVICSICE